MARSSAVTVSQPNLNMYRPGSVTRPACCQVILLTLTHFPFAFSSPPSSRFAPSKDQISIWAQKKWHVAGFLVVRKLGGGFRNFIRLTFQARPFHRLRIAGAAENHFLAASHHHDVANAGSRITSDGNHRRSELLGHGRAVKDFCKRDRRVRRWAGGPCRTHK
jgi:hypothetical protein